jgi:hypothetical protein
VNFTRKIISKLLSFSSIVKTERETPSPSHIMKEYSWIDENRSDDVMQRTDPLGNRGIYCIHSYPKLREIPASRIAEVETNLANLKDAAEG